MNTPLKYENPKIQPLTFRTKMKLKIQLQHPCGRTERKLLPVLSVPDFVELDMFELSVGCHCCLKNTRDFYHTRVRSLKPARYERGETCVCDEVRQLTGARGPVPLLKSMLPPSARAVEMNHGARMREPPLPHLVFVFFFLQIPVTYGG